MLGDRANCRLAYRENGLGGALWLCWRWQKRSWASMNWWCLLPKRLVLTVCNTSGWEWSWSKWFWYFCQLFANSKMHLPIASEIYFGMAPQVPGETKIIWRAFCRLGVCWDSCSKKLRDIYADIRYCWNLLCVIVTGMYAWNEPDGQWYFYDVFYTLLKRNEAIYLEMSFVFWRNWLLIQFWL